MTFYADDTPRWVEDMELRRERDRDAEDAEREYRIERLYRVEDRHAYDPRDPKHPDYHDALSALYDDREKA